MQIRIDQRFILASILVMLLVIVYLPLGSVETQATTKKLIEYGWDAPTPDFFNQHIKEMEQRPFDGVVVKLNAGKVVFKKDAYPDTAFYQDRQDLAKTRSTDRLTDNFVIMWAGMDQGWDWFDNTDWAAAEQNIYNFAKTAKAGRFRGIAFDPEPYAASPWIYEQQPQQETKTLPEYQQQVRKRGAQFMKALQRGQPGAQVLTFGLLSWMKWIAKTEPSKLPQELAKHPYGLWPAFINGMLDVIQPISLIIDGHEWSYYFSNATAFNKTRDSIFKDVRIFVEPANYQKYDTQVKLGQSIFLDLSIDLFPPQTKLYGKTMPHFLAPDHRLQLLEHNIYHSLRTADRYSWIYSERVDWWKNKIPPGVETAMRRAKAKIHQGKSLGFDIDPIIKAALKKCKTINQICELVA